MILEGNERHTPPLCKSVVNVIGESMIEWNHVEGSQWKKGDYIRAGSKLGRRFK